MALLDQYLTQVIVHTGQNYDFELNEISGRNWNFVNLTISSMLILLRWEPQFGDILRKTEEVIKLEKPDALTCACDTNSCLSAYIAKRMHIPIFQYGSR